MNLREVAREAVISDSVFNYEQNSNSKMAIIMFGEVWPKNLENH